MPTSVSSGEAAREARARRHARRQGFALHKDRARSFNIDHHGGYMVVDWNRNIVVAGSRYELDLGDVEEFLAGEN